MKIMTNYINMTVKAAEPAFEKLDKDHPRLVIPELMREFSSHGSMTGTSCGVSIKLHDRIYVAPYGGQNDKLTPEDVFALSESGDVLESPLWNKRLRVAKEFCPLLLAAFTKRGAGAVIHTHSKSAIITATSRNFSGAMKLSHTEVIRRITNDYVGKKPELIVPRVENNPSSEILLTNIENAMDKYPDTHAVIVRNHGIYVWADNWRSAKELYEYYEYILHLFVETFPFGCRRT